MININGIEYELAPIMLRKLKEILTMQFDLPENASVTNLTELIDKINIYRFAAILLQPKDKSLQKKAIDELEAEIKNRDLSIEDAEAVLSHFFDRATSQEFQKFAGMILAMPQVTILHRKQ